MGAAEIAAAETQRDFIRDIVRADLAAGRHGTVVTRFPPEPNGYLHIGHAKSICLNFGVAQEFGGHCNLRFDDTNPLKEELRYIEAIKQDVRWLGFDWGEHLHFASDYFEQLYEWAEHLVRHGDAYVDDLSPEEMRAYRGTLTEPGRNSPYRDRPVAENLDLLRRMRAGEFPDGARVLRAKIDMASGNINLRDPVLYRILHARASAHRRCLVHLSDLRLRARPVGCDRRGDALAVHARVRGSPPAVRLADRASAGAEPAAPVRVRAAQSVAHHPVQAPPDPAGRGGPRARLGRSAHAHARRAAPARRAAGGDPRVRAADRGRQGRQPGRCGTARALRARAAEPHRRAPDGGATAAESGDRELSRRRDRAVRGDQQSRGSGGRHAPGAVCAGAVHRARRLHGGAAARVLPPRARARGAPALRLSDHMPGGGEGRRRQRSAAALHLRSGEPRRRCAGRTQGQGDPALGRRAPCPARRGAAVRPSVHAPGARRRRRFPRRPQPALARGPERLPPRARRWPTRRAKPSSSSVRATSAAIPNSSPERLVFNRTVALRDTWAKLQTRRA